jgi:hypothetical protein
MATEVKVSKLPPCDICLHVQKVQDPPLAGYDGATKEGPWAYMCEGCFGKHGIGLGTGVGQRLVLNA